MRVGIAGGGDADARAARYGRLDGVTVAGVVGSTAEEYRAYDHVEALVGSETIDVLDCAGPPDGRRDLVTTATERGLDAVCPQPLATDPEDAAAIRDLAAGSESAVLVERRHRHTREYAGVREAVEAGELGELTTARTERLMRTVGAAESELGDAFARALTPDVGALGWLVGGVERAFTRTATGGDLQQAATVLRFESGAVGHLDTTLGVAFDAPATASLELSGTEGQARFDTDDLTPVSGVDREADGAAGGWHAPPLLDDSLDRQLGAFVDVLAGNREYDEERALADAVDAVNVVAAAVESAETGAPVAVEEVGA